MPCREGPAFFSHFQGFGIGVFHGKTHQPATQLDSLFRVVRNAEQHKHVGKSHQSQSQLPGVPGHILDGVDRILVRVDYVVEHPGGQSNRLAKTLPIDIGETCRVLDDELCDVNRTEIARLVWQKRLFTTRIGRRDATEVQNRAVPVDLVEENHARFAIAPCTVNDLAEHLAGAQPVYLNNLTVEVRGIGECAERVGRAVFDRLHKLVGSSDRDIEIVDFTFDALAFDELENIGMVNVEHGHVRTVTLAALRYKGRDR